VVDFISAPTISEILREEFMEPMKLSAYQLAKEIHVPVSRIQAILNLEFPGILLTVASNDPRKFKGRWKSQIVPIHPYIFPLIFSTTFISINSSI